MWMMAMMVGAHATPLSLPEGRHEVRFDVSMVRDSPGPGGRAQMSWRLIVEAIHPGDPEDPQTQWIIRPLMRTLWEASAKPEASKDCAKAMRLTGGIPPTFTRLGGAPLGEGQESCRGQLAAGIPVLLRMLPHQQAESWTQQVEVFDSTLMAAWRDEGEGRYVASVNALHSSSGEHLKGDIVAQIDEAGALRSAVFTLVAMDGGDAQSVITVTLTVAPILLPSSPPGD